MAKFHCGCVFRRSRFDAVDGEAFVPRVVWENWQPMVDCWGVRGREATAPQRRQQRRGGAKARREVCAVLASPFEQPHGEHAARLKSVSGRRSQQKTNTVHPISGGGWGERLAVKILRPVHRFRHGKICVFDPFAPLNRRNRSRIAFVHSYAAL